MSKFEDYANKYRTIRMERRNGILQMTLHTDGGPLRWGFLPHGELPDAFYDVGADRDNRVVIITGTGAEFSGPRANPGTSSFPTRPAIERIDRIHWEGRHLLMRRAVADRRKDGISLYFSACIGSTDGTCSPSCLCSSCGSPRGSTRPRGGAWEQPGEERPGGGCRHGRSTPASAAS
jgi:hypothetical protein